MIMITAVITVIKCISDLRQLKGITKDIVKSWTCKKHLSLSLFLKR